MTRIRASHLSIGRIAMMVSSWILNSTDVTVEVTRHDTFAVLNVTGSNGDSFSLHAKNVAAIRRFADSLVRAAHHARGPRNE